MPLENHGISGLEAPNNHLIYATCSPGAALLQKLLPVQPCLQVQHSMTHQMNTLTVPRPGSLFSKLLLLVSLPSEGLSLLPRLCDQNRHQQQLLSSKRSSPGHRQTRTSCLGGNSKPSKEESRGRAQAGCSLLLTGQGGG